MPNIPERARLVQQFSHVVNTRLRLAERTVTSPHLQSEPWADAQVEHVIGTVRAAFGA